MKKLLGIVILGLLLSGNANAFKVTSWKVIKVIGDPVYGSRNKFSTGTGEQLKKIIASFGRQALHAAELELIHPTTKEMINFKVDLPVDMQYLIEKLKDGN